MRDFPKRTQGFNSVDYLAVTVDGRIVDIGENFHNYYTGTTYYSSCVAFRCSYNLKNGTYGVMACVEIDDGAL